MLEVLLEVVVVLVAAAAVRLAVELELVFLEQLQLRESHLKTQLEDIRVKIGLYSPYRYHRC